MKITHTTHGDITSWGHDPGEECIHPVEIDLDPIRTTPTGTMRYRHAGYQLRIMVALPWTLDILQGTDEVCQGIRAQIDQYCRDHARAHDHTDHYVMLSLADGIFGGTDHE
jgi:hypothetical protein